MGKSVSEARESSPQSAAAVGELFLDHLFVEEDGVLRYRGSCGGGTSASALANWTPKQNATALGALGDDDFAVVVEHDLGKLKIILDALTRRGHRSHTRFQINRPLGGGLLGRVKHQFTTACPVCGRPDQNSVARIGDQLPQLLDAAADSDMLFLDRLSQPGGRAATRAKRRGVRTVAILDRHDYLRFIPVAEALAHLRAFDLVVMSRPVARSLARRAGVNDASELMPGGLKALAVVADDEGRVDVFDAMHRRQPQHQRLHLESGGGDNAGVLEAIAGSFASLLDSPAQDRDFSAFDAALEPARRAAEASGALGHFLQLTKGPVHGNEDLAGRSVDDLRLLLDGLKPCPFCGRRVSTTEHSSRQRSWRPGSRDNIARLQKRMLFASERPRALDECRSILGQQGTAYVVGSGGSYPVAVFLSLLFADQHSLFAQPIRPFDYVRLGTTSDFVFVISYSGSTADCREVIRHAHAAGVRHVVLVSGNSTPPLADELNLDRGDAIISYGRAAEKDRPSALERGFVSIAGTVAPCSMWTAAAIGASELAHLVAALPRQIERDNLETESLAGSLRLHPSLAVFGGGMAWPAIVDLESKFTEGDVADVQIHEAKDFSHGRFTAVLGPEGARKPILLLGIGRREHPYEQALRQALEESLEPGDQIVHLHSRFDGILGALELLVRIQFLAQRCGEMLGKDISRPEWIPDRGLGLYRWAGGLRSGSAVDPPNPKEEQLHLGDEGTSVSPSKRRRRI
jgi:fructoselysine-6-P-deglycase FrlB-like protein